MTKSHLTPGPPGAAVTTPFPAGPVTDQALPRGHVLAGVETTIVSWMPCMTCVPRPGGGRR